MNQNLILYQNLLTELNEVDCDGGGTQTFTGVSGSAWMPEALEMEVFRFKHVEYRMKTRAETKWREEIGG